MQRVTLVLGVAKGLLVMPLVVLAISVALKVAAWLLGRRPSRRASPRLVAMLPIAVFHLAELVAASRQVATPAALDLVQLAGSGVGSGLLVEVLRALVS
jgi:hypothetical protein